MTVTNHLTNLRNQLVLSGKEKESIEISIRTLSAHLNNHFDQEIVEHFKFGSSTRGTILPRKADANSDIDYMIVFKNPNNLKPQTFLDKLKRFANHYYRQSDIKQSHPTIVLELNHIKFELVPAMKDWFNQYKIPSRGSLFIDWIETDPSGFNEKISQVNRSNSSLIKPTIRIIKYWNSNNNSIFPSFQLENKIVNNNYFLCSTLKEYVYQTFEDLIPNWDASQTSKDKINRAKKIVAKAKDEEKDGYPYLAKIEIEKILPPL